MNWKSPNQKVEMGRTCSTIRDRERDPAHHCGKKYLGISQPVHPQSQRSSHLTMPAYHYHGQTSNHLTDWSGGSASSSFQNIAKQLYVLVMSSGVENIKRSFEEKGKWSLEQSMFLVILGEYEEGGKTQRAEVQTCNPSVWVRGMNTILHII